MSKIQKNNAASTTPVCREPVSMEKQPKPAASNVSRESKAPQKPAASQPQKSSFEKADARKDRAQKLVSKSGGKQQQYFSQSTKNLHTKGKVYSGTKGKSGFHTEMTAAQANARIGTKDVNVKVEAKALSAEAKSTINTKNRSVSASLAATAVEYGGTHNYKNWGVGAKIGVGVGAGGRVSLCDDQNKDGKKEVSIDLSGGLLGKFSLSFRFPNPLARYVCNK